MTSPRVFHLTLALLVAGCGAEPPPSATAVHQPAPAGSDVGKPCSCGAAGDPRVCAPGLSCCCDPASRDVGQAGNAGTCDVRCPEVGPAAGGGTVTGGLPDEPVDEGGAVTTGGDGCTADSRHCCMRDGTTVVPGGCQPSYPDGVRPATRRGPDGFCVDIRCFLRCLPPTAVISTPRGGLAIADLRVGDLVWTLDGSGARVAEPIRRMGTIPAAGAQTLVELTLADGRTLRASGGHPTGYGATLDALGPGSGLDGTTVVRARRVPLEAGTTWDLLPAGATGLYWADGVLLGSTLAED